MALPGLFLQAKMMLNDDFSVEGNHTPEQEKCGHMTAFFLTGKIISGKVRRKGGGRVLTQVIQRLRSILNRSRNFWQKESIPLFPDPKTCSHWHCMG